MSVIFAFSCVSPAAFPPVVITSVLGGRRSETLLRLNQSYTETKTWRSVALAGGRVE